MEPVRTGLVGYGFGGRYFHAPLIAAAEECELVGVVTRSAERRALIGDEHPGVATFDSLEDLAAAGAEAVAISTPADTHSALTDAAIALGLSVVCDKPFALDPAAARRSVRLADAAGVTLSPYQNRRWDSDFLTVCALVEDGTLGDVRRFESRFERYAPADGPGASGGGTLLDFGAHLVDQALVLLGPVESVHAEWRTRESGLDDDVFVALRHAEGAVSHLWGSWSQHAPGPRFRVTGTQASLVVTTGDTQEDVLLTGATPATVARGAPRRSPTSTGCPARRGPRRSRCTAGRGTPTTRPSPAPSAARARHPSRAPTPWPPPTCWRPPGSAPPAARR